MMFPRSAALSSASFVAIAQGVAVAHLKIKGVGVVVVIRFRNRMIFVDLIGDFIIAGRQLCKLAVVFLRYRSHTQPESGDPYAVA